MGKRFVHILYIILMITVPVFITLWMGQNVTIREREVSLSGRYILRQKESHAERIDMEQYLIGALAAYVPYEYEAETYKCMAVLFRTSMYLTFLEAGEDVVELPEEEMEFTAYSLEEMQEVWKDNFSNQYDKIQKAVQDTSGEVLYYEDELIQPFFHMVSAGKTRGLNGYPYLKATDSNYDMKVDNFLRMEVFEFQELIDKIYEMDGVEVQITEDLESSIAITSLDGMYVDAIGFQTTSQENYSMSGEHFAEMMGLPSPAFSIENYNGKCRILSRGEGSGLGLSVYGANEMALLGENYSDIISAYYSSVVITH